MRPIKFRVWYKPEQKMHFYLKAKFGTGTNITLEGKFKDVDQITTKTVPNGDLEVMQFTGLYDKNGAEIFEGDILASKSEPADQVDRATVFWAEDIAGFAWKLPGLSFNKPGIKYFEVIGNIYENPELLQS